MFSSHLQNRSKFTTIFLNLVVFLVPLEELEMLAIQFHKNRFHAKSLCVLTWVGSLEVSYRAVGLHAASLFCCNSCVLEPSVQLSLCLDY